MRRPVGYVVLTTEFHKEDAQWVGVCRELGTSAFGDTVDEAREALADLVLLHLNTLESLGERQAFFREHGITFCRHKPARETSISVGFNRLVERLIEPIPRRAVAPV